MGSVTFMCFLNPNFMQKNHKKMMRQSWDYGVTDAPTDGRSWIYRTLQQSQGSKNKNKKYTSHYLLLWKIISSTALKEQI